MKKVPSTVVKNRSRGLTTLFESFAPYTGMEGKVERIWITEIATDRIHLVGHTEGYIQVLVIGPETMLGTSAIVKITSVGRWSVFGEVMEILNQENNEDSCERRGEKYSSCSNLDACACSKEPEPRACETTSCCGQVQEIEGTVSVIKNDPQLTDQSSKSLIGWILRKRKSNSDGMENGVMLQLKGKQKKAPGYMPGWSPVDRALLGGLLVSLLTILAVSLYLGSRNF